MYFQIKINVDYLTSPQSLPLLNNHKLYKCSEHKEELRKRGVGNFEDVQEIEYSEWFNARVSIIFFFFFIIFFNITLELCLIIVNLSQL